MKGIEPEDVEGTGNPDGPEESDMSATESALDRPEWDDECLNRAAERLMYNYNLQREYAVRGERFDLFGSMRMENQKQFLHRSINCANHHAIEYVFVRWVDTATIAELERLVGLGHALANEWIEPDKERYGTKFTFVLVADAVPEEVRVFTSDFTNRTLLKSGYYGHYRMNLAVVTPNDEDAAASRNTNSVTAFTFWSDSSLAAADRLSDRLLGRLRQ